MDDAVSVLGVATAEVRHRLAHDQWAAAHEQEAHLLCKALGDTLLDVQHVGSTAVPGLMARPFLDVIVAVTNLEIVAELERKLAAIDGMWRPSGDTEARRYFDKGPPERRTGRLPLSQRVRLSVAIRFASRIFFM
jgi:GrpB-like predicted nucleotidyltransferase (UPF0157 family)